jgi:hypothetical protein
MDDVLGNLDLLIKIYLLSGCDPVFMQVCNEWIEILLKEVALGNIEKPVITAGNHAPYDSASDFTKSRFTPEYRVWSLHIPELYLQDHKIIDITPLSFLQPVAFAEYPLNLTNYTIIDLP